MNNEFKTSPSVIIIDDDHDIVEVLSEFLTLKSINVLAVGYDGKDAVELVQKHNPDYVLLDYNMPKYDGLYGIQEIRKIPSSCKIILITGSADLESKIELLTQGIDELLIKPTNLENLLSILHGEINCK